MEMLCLKAQARLNSSLLLLFISYLFGNIAQIGSPAMFLYGSFVFLYVYAFTELMDRATYAWVWELLKDGLGIGIILYTGDWFGTGHYFVYAPQVLIGYFLLSMLVCLYFVSRNRQQGTAVSL